MLLIEDHVRVKKFILPLNGFHKHLQCVLSTVDYRPDNAAKNKFDSVPEVKNRTNVPRLAKALLLPKINARRGNEHGDSAFIQYMKCTEPVKKGDKGLGFMSAR